MLSECSIEYKFSAATNSILDLWLPEVLTVIQRYITARKNPRSHKKRFSLGNWCLAFIWTDLENTVSVNCTYPKDIHSPPPPFHPSLICVRGVYKCTYMCICVYRPEGNVGVPFLLRHHHLVFESGSLTRSWESLIRLRLDWASFLRQGLTVKTRHKLWAMLLLLHPEC